jgi:hypothetical protein
MRELKMKKHAAALGALAMIVGLGAARTSEPCRLAGHYIVQWEEQSFQPCGGSEKWWVADPGPLMRRYRDVVKGRNFGVVYATVVAEVSDRGSWGHLGMFPRSIAVREVIDARAPSDADCPARDTEIEAR